jgi:hypothetical protein
VNVALCGVNQAPLALRAPLERQQGLSKYGRWSVRISGNDLLKPTEAGLLLVLRELREERMGAQARPLEHVTAGAGFAMTLCSG